jgi:hypothetical protein
MFIPDPDIFPIPDPDSRVKMHRISDPQRFPFVICNLTHLKDGENLCLKY